MRIKLTFIFLFLSLLMLTFSAHSGGYQVRLQGQKQTGIALIGTPFYFDASSIFYNPGALAMIQQKYNFTGGVSTIFSNGVFRKSGTDYEVRTNNPVSPPFYFYGSGKISENLAIGIGVYVPFGSSADWGKDWHGKYLVQDISLNAKFFQPTISYKINNYLSLGAGFVYATGKFELNRAADVGPYSSVNMEGIASGIGYNIGVLINPVKKLSIGIDYRSEIIMEADDGMATFKPEDVEFYIPPEHKFSADLPMPANLDFGLAFKFSEKFTLAAEVNWVMWSTYDSLIFIFEEGSEMPTIRSPRKYSDSWITRLGAQYKYNEKLTFRAGVYYDPTPTNEDYYSPETVSLNTIAFTLGLTYEPIEDLQIDLSYLQLHGLESEKSYEPYSFTGTYKTLTMIPGIGLSYSF